MLPENKKQIGLASKVIMVAAGKGGVGKSTISVLLAKQLKVRGYKVGLLDADIYGPSIPIILNIEDKLPKIIDNFFIPIDAEGIAVMSIGFLIKKESALVWRGPMLSKALNQLLFSTSWGNLDYLILDMPPGTGDIHISIIQRCIIEGVVIVSTPDKIAVGDVERAIDLYKKMQIHIIGVVENMSYMEVGDQKIQLFGSDGGDSIANKFGLKILAKLPLIPNLSANSNLYSAKELQIKFEL